MVDTLVDAADRTVAAPATGGPDVQGGWPKPCPQVELGAGDGFGDGDPHGWPKIPPGLQLGDGSGDGEPQGWPKAPG